MKVMDTMLPFKELNKILLMTLRRGEWIETPIAYAWPCCGERELQRNLQEISSKRDLPLMDSGCHWSGLSVLCAQPSPCLTAHQLFTVKCAWKGITNKTSGITVAFSHHTYYSKSTNKCLGLLSFHLLSLFPLQKRRVLISFCLLKYFLRKHCVVPWVPNCLSNKTKDTCSVSHFSNLLWNP